MTPQQHVNAAVAIRPTTKTVDGNSNFVPASEYMSFEISTHNFEQVIVAALSTCAIVGYDH